MSWKKMFKKASTKKASTSNITEEQFGDINRKKL